LSLVHEAARKGPAQGLARAADEHDPRSRQLDDAVHGGGRAAVLGHGIQQSTSGSARAKPRRPLPPARPWSQDARVPVPRLLSVLTLALTLAACRDHHQAEGRYQLTATSVTADGCGLVGAAGELGEVSLAVYGNEVQGLISLATPGLDLTLDG